jgi:hypothetical protein
MSDVGGCEDKEKTEYRAWHPKEEGREGVEAEPFDDDAGKVGETTVRNVLAKCIGKDEPGLRVAKGFNELIFLPLGVLETMSLLLWATVGVVAAIRREEAGIEWGVWEKNQ